MDHIPQPHYTAKISAAISAVTSLVVIGTLAYHTLEPWNWIQSFYFTVATLTTVGYGDLHPTSDGTRLFTAIFILVGVAVVVTSLTIIGTAYLERRTSRALERQTGERR